MSKKPCPLLYSWSLYKDGQDFLDMLDESEVLASRILAESVNLSCCGSFFILDGRGGGQNMSTLTFCGDFFFQIIFFLFYI